MIEVIKEYKPRANKNHICNYCETPISRGEQYCRTVLRYDNEVYTWKSHQHCDMVAQELMLSGYVDPDDNGCTTDDFKESCREIHDEFIESDGVITMAQITTDLSLLFAIYDLKAHKPNGYTIGYKLKRRIRNEIF